jgi:hypothetical protein
MTNTIEADTLRDWLESSEPSWLSAWLTSESGFVERITSKLSPPPSNFVRIVELNFVRRVSAQMTY